jgi:hypothetical protein
VGALDERVCNVDRSAPPGRLTVTAGCPIGPPMLRLAGGPRRVGDPADAPITLMTPICWYQHKSAQVNG